MKELKKEKSCGCIIIKNKKVLLIYEKQSEYWGFPKGHIEGKETETQTALREVKEEVGLDVEIDETKRYSLNYITNSQVDKTTVLYVATPKNEDLKLQESEVEDAKWCTFDEALKILTFANLKEVFSKALKDITKNDC